MTSLVEQVPTFGGDSAIGALSAASMDERCIIIDEGSKDEIKKARCTFMNSTGHGSMKQL